MLKEKELLYGEELSKYTEDCVEQIEIYLRKLFENENLKLGFKIYDNYNTISMLEFLTTQITQFGEIRVYVINNLEHDTMGDNLKNHNYSDDDIKFIGNFSIDQLPGCCGVAVFFHQYIPIDLWNKGIGQRIVKLAKCISKDKDFTRLICTDRLINTPITIIMDKLGFRSMFIFKNKKTGNFVELRSSDLRDIKYYDLKCNKTSLTSRGFQVVKNYLKMIYSVSTTKLSYLKDTLETQLNSKKATKID